MADKHEYLIPDPEFNLFVYHCLCQAHSDKIQSLQPGDLVHFKDTKAKKKFAERASLEEKLRMITMLGSSWCIVTAQQGVDTMPVLAEVNAPTKVGRKKLTVTDVMARDKMFVISSRDVLIAAHLAAQQAHSKVYQLNQHHLNAYQNLTEAYKEISGGELQEARESFNMISKLVLNLMIGIEDVSTIAAVSTVTPLEMKVLLALYHRRNSYIDTVELSSMMPAMSIKGAGKVCTLLEKKGYLTSIRLRPTERTRIHKFLIIEQGIDTVYKWVKYLVRNIDPL